MKLKSSKPRKDKDIVLYEEANSRHYIRVRYGITTPHYDQTRKLTSTSRISRSTSFFHLLSPVSPLWSNTLRLNLLWLLLTRTFAEVLINRTKISLCNNIFYICMIKMTDEHFCEELFIIKYLETFQQGRLKFSIKYKSMQLNNYF